MVVVSLDSLFVIDCVHKHVVFAAVLLKLRKTLYVLRLVVEPSRNH